MRLPCNQTVGITETLMNARSLWLTPQTTTPYVHAEIDTKHGPVVLELGTPVIGLIDDAYFRYVGDLGGGGPDKGKGASIWLSVRTSRAISRTVTLC